MQRASSFLVFLFVSISFFIFRSTAGLVWNDSPQTVENIYGFHQDTLETASNPICRDQGAYGLKWSNPHLMGTIFKRSFSCLEFGGYRPLSAALSFTAVSLFSEAYLSPQKNYLATIWIILVSFLFGFLAVLLFSLARRYVKTDFAAYGVLILFFMSPCVLSGAWILFSGGIQVTVPLCICLGLWLYFKAIESKKYFWKILLALSLFLSPWVREYTGIVSGLICFLELQKHRRITGLMVLSVVTFLHALFPTALMHIFIPELPIRLVFKLGSLAAQLGTSLVKWEVRKVFLLLMPPLLYAFALLALLLSVPTFSLRSKKNKDILFLILWFVASILPFFRVYSAHVHLAYPLMPATILMAMLLEHFYFTYKKMRGLLYVILSVCLLDQFCNVYGSYWTVKSLYGGITAVSEWFQKNTPKGSFVVSNALHAEDIRYYSKNHILPFWSVGTGVPPERTLDKPDNMRKFLKKNLGTHKVYLLDMDQEYADLKVNYHAHKYVTRKTIQTKPVGLIHSTYAKIPFVDPFKNFISRQTILFLGPPDLENDIYFGRDRLSKLFFNEISVNYFVYDVVDAKVSRWADYMPDSTFLHTKLQQEYKKYKIYGYRDKLIAVPEEATKKSLDGQTMEEIKNKIDSKK